jgi:MazG family protein
MVKLIEVGTGGPESCPPEAIAALRECPRRFHADPRDASFSWLAEVGFPCEPLPAEGAPDGSAIVIPFLGAAAAPPKEPGEPERDPNSAMRTRRAQALESLVQVVDRLLGPSGCPWDREQTHESLKRHLIEECYELIDAIDSGSKERLREELGDLLLQPLMHAEMERCAGSFAIEDVADTAREKLIRRHPHVFGPLGAADADEVLRNWDRIKMEERIKGQGASTGSILDGVPRAMPALLRAFEVSKRAARVGFEWPDIEAVFDKLREEEIELRHALQAGLSKRIEEEVGDLLFTAVNLARWAKVEPEEALRRMLDRFTVRFVRMEAGAGKALPDLSPEEWDELWETSKTVDSSQG